MIVGFRCQYKGNIAFEDCLRCAATQGQPCAFSYPILWGMMQGEQEDVEGIRVTWLLNCLRKVALERRHDIYVPPEELYWSFRGRLAHAIVEYAQADDAVVEERFTRVVAGIPITGKPDVIYPARKLLVDYKTTATVPKRGPYEHHALQLSIYRWLVQAHFQISRLVVVYLDMRETRKYPVPALSLKRVEELIAPRARSLDVALKGGALPPQADGQGLWQCWGYCPFVHHPDCWGKDGPPERNRRETRGESRRRAIRRAYARRGGKGR